MKRLISLVLALMLVFAAVPSMAETETLPDGYSRLQNPYLQVWSEIFTLYQKNSMEENPDGDYSFINGNIIYDENSMRSNGAGVYVADGGATSILGSFNVGMGACPDNDEIWYVSFTFSSATNAATIVDVTVDMLKTTSIIFNCFGETDEEAAENMMSVAAALLENNGDFALEVANMVIAVKYVGNQMIIMVDSLDFYNAFYKGSISNYWYL